MKKTKLATIVLVIAVMVSSLVACGSSSEEPETTDSVSTEAPLTAETAPSTDNEGDSAAPAVTEAPAPTEATAPTEAPAAQTVTPSIDFEDGLFAFAAVDTGRGGADNSILEVVDYNGSKALKATNVDGKNMFVAFNLSALLGDKLADVKEIRVDLGTENADKFAASSGRLYCMTGEDNKEVKANEWSVYIETANPKTAKFDVSGKGFIAGGENYVVLSKETDNSKTTPSNLLIDNIAFLDENGATIAADTSAEFGNPAGFAAVNDRSNLFALTKTVDWEGYAVSAGAWAQAGVPFTDKVLEALVPGSVIEIEYTSETGNMWIVMNESAAGWMRVGVGDADGSGQQYAYVNGKKNIAQVTFEQIAAQCGDDVSTWGSQIQCESDGAWAVTSVKVGQKAPAYAITHAVDFEGFQVSAGAWAQAGIPMTDAVIAALVPGSVVEISYKSETGNMWIVMNEAQAGWMRVGVGDADGSGQGYAVCDGSKAYVTYEDLAQYCGEDVSTWGSTMQCESDGEWEVYGIRVGKGDSFAATNSHIDLGAVVSAGAWAQAGVDLTEDQIAALVPGSVIDAEYTSETGELWLVFPAAEQGWTRVGVGDYDGSGQGYSKFDGRHCQVTFEDIAEILGDDTSKWGTMIQFEASSEWSVTSASIGFVK
ncbi:MAG: hypothetical protein K6F44_01380 [Lachnospiraceae bacterium]|nr:hypothetical protein [Lachnospiraceae bacterium]